MTIRVCRVCFVLLAGLTIASAAHANQKFSDLPAPTGAFEWDVFDAQGAIGLAGPHPPDVRSVGLGSGAMTVSNATIPPGAPGPQITSGFDLYAGSSIATHTINLTGAITGSAQTTLVLQIAASSNGTPLSNSSVLLDSATAPTEFLYRGVQGGKHYYWAEWQTSAASSYSVKFGGGPHLSLTGAQLEYVNSATTFNATAPNLVPEPASATLLGGSALAFFAALRKRRGAGSL